MSRQGVSCILEFAIFFMFLLAFHSLIFDGLEGVLTGSMIILLLFYLTMPKKAEHKFKKNVYHLKKKLNHIYEQIKLNKR